MPRRTVLENAWIAAVLLAAATSARAQQDSPVAAQAYGKAQAAVAPQPDGLIVCEGEEFQVSAPGWQAQPWGENYYAATFANTFLSRKAFLGAPEQCDETIATRTINVNEAGKYLVLVRYEAVFRFQTQFRIKVEQAGKVLLNRVYGARKNTKIWAFSQKLKAEVGWSWGAVENVVWEGHDASVALKAGAAKITLSAGKQPEPAARRNIDLVLLTSDAAAVQARIDKERYLPLDGLLTQSGDVFVKVHNRGAAKVQFKAKPCTEHSPYWVHQRTWKPLAFDVAAGKTTEWIDVGGLLDSLNDGQWIAQIVPAASCRVEFGVRAASGAIETINTFEGNFGNLPLAYHADTRYSRRLRRQEDVAYDLVAYLKKQPVHGKTPARTLIYGYTFKPGLGPKYDASVAEFRKMFALVDTQDSSSTGRPQGYIDVRSVPTGKLAEHCQKLGDRAARIAVVSLGDEIGLPTPSGAAAGEGFRAWLKSQGLRPADVDPAAGNDWAKITYSPNPTFKATKPGLYYWSKRFLYHYGVGAIKARTDILRKHLPAAGIGANFSPHYPTDHAYLGEVFKWVSVFRREGMTMPWGEDYIWQLPVGSPQMNFINLDLFRAGLRGKPQGKILYYCMPHWPGNTPRMWRRLFYGSLAHGMKIVNLFEFRPVQAAYTENHVSHDPMYATVLASFRELGTFEDIVQDGHVRQGEAALWFSETGDVWGDSHGSFAPAKRALYTAVRHQQVPLDFVVEADAIDGTLGSYKTLYLADAHVSAAASQKIAAWVRGGGTLLATAGAGMFDELNRPNKVLQEVLGVTPSALEASDEGQVTFIKQDLPFAPTLDTVTWKRGEEYVKLPVIAVRGRFKPAGATVAGTFADGSPALATRSMGKGRAIYCGFLPGLGYYQPAIPKRPVDRGSSDDAMSHFMPTEFDPGTAALIALAAEGAARPVTSSEPLVETTVIESPHGTLVPLVNWSGSPIAELRVAVSLAKAPAKVSLASGRPVKEIDEDGRRVFVLSLDVADAIILR